MPESIEMIVQLLLIFRLSRGSLRITISKIPDFCHGKNAVFSQFTYFDFTILPVYKNKHRFRFLAKFCISLYPCEYMRRALKILQLVAKTVFWPVRHEFGMKKFPPVTDVLEDRWASMTG